MHFWICLDLRQAGKLVRSELNSQIRRYLHFSSEKVRIVIGRLAARFPLSPNYSKSREGSTSHFRESRIFPPHKNICLFALARPLSIESLLEALARPLSTESDFSSESQIFGVIKNLGSLRKFSQGIRSTQRMHFWICYDLQMIGKLVRSQLNTHIQSSGPFSIKKLRIVMGTLGARGKPSTVVTARDDSQSPSTIMREDNSAEKSPRAPDYVSVIRLSKRESTENQPKNVELP